MESLVLLKFNEYSPESFDLVSALQSHSRLPNNGNSNVIGVATVKKRRRRNGFEIVRDFHCTFCDKSYGCKSHLNTHKRLKGHRDIRIAESN